jgi:hypothetical protein
MKLEFAEVRRKKDQFSWCQSFPGKYFQSEKQLWGKEEI